MSGSPRDSSTSATRTGFRRGNGSCRAGSRGGYCLRTAAQGSCAYANICEHCPNFRSEASFLPVLQLQRADAEALAADAQARGWGEEAARHRRLIERLDLLITQADAS
jgi:hypothetical protein